MPSGRIPGAINFLGEPEDVKEEDRQRLEDALRSLAADGLIEVQNSLAGWISAHAMLTDRGRSVIQGRRDRRSDHVARAMVARDSMLDWLYGCMTKGESPNIGQFHLDPRSHFDGDPFSESEAAATSKYLKERGLIRGTVAWGGGIVRPEITPDGQTVIEQAGSLATWDATRAGGTTVNNTLSGNFGGPVGIGTNVTQQQTIGVDPAEFGALVADLRDALASLSVEDRARADVYVEMIEGEAASAEPNRGVLTLARDGLIALGDKASNALIGTSMKTLWAYLSDKWGLPSSG